MSDRSLRGMRLGSQSMETESNVQPAPASASSTALQTVTVFS